MNKGFIIIILILIVFCVLAVGMYIYSLYEGLGTNTIQQIPPNGVIPKGYYNIPNSKNMAPIPTGYRLINVDGSGNGTLTQLTGASIYTAAAEASNPSWSEKNISSTMIDASFIALTGRYDTNNYDTEYHETAEQLKSSDADTNAGTWILDKSGNKINVPWSDISGSITYYTPGTYTYGASSYVPNYEDSIYLSRTTGQGTPTALYDTVAMKGGFCVQNASNKGNMEQICNVINKNECASTECCVLLGGTKCVAGDEKGPYFKSNYSDPFMRNKDVYYYKGKCFGNCENEMFPRML